MTSTGQNPLVVCEQVSHTFGTGPQAIVAVHGTSCRILPGQRIAVAGPSGSGKSTLLHLLAGLEPPTGGSVEWPGLDPSAAARVHQIGVIFQSPSLLPTLDVLENVSLPLVLQGRDADDADARAAHALELLGLAELADQLPEELSGGQAQRVAAARVLAQEPLLVLADEPTGQLDQATGKLLLDALLDATIRLGAALVVATHDQAVIGRLEVRWAMHEGRLETHDNAGAKA
ncbi:MAG TPA: ATP-binding cassette domain-containing protein [Pedococcus sp.]|jgi:putative ABC transport system ATP-binding protein|nr:ATP-binding cassette domain-containing protein [Pedococcus sp.]